MAGILSCGEDGAVGWLQRVELHRRISFAQEAANTHDGSAGPYTGHESIWD